MTSEYDSLSASQKYTEFVKIITSAISQCTPRKTDFVPKNLKPKNPVPWWDAECEMVKRLRRAKLKKWKFSKKCEDKVEYKKYNALAKKTFKRKKKECFHTFAAKINIQTDPNYVWNTSKILKNCSIKNYNQNTLENLQYTEKID